jgi:hypothetical protein
MTEQSQPPHHILQGTQKGRFKFEIDHEIHKFYHHPPVLNGGNLHDKQDTQNISTFADGRIRKTCNKFKQQTTNNF